MKTTKTFGIAAAITIMLIGGAVLVQTDAHASTSTVPVYRLYNPYTGEHFYTASKTEGNSLVRIGWTYEGRGWQGKTSGTPVYRVYNPNAKGGDHYYTQSKFEAQSLVNRGWRWDAGGKAVFYSGGNTNLYVAYNPNAQSGAHNYTTSKGEQNSLLSIGWKFGTVAWKVAGPGLTKPSGGSGVADFSMFDTGPF